MGISNRTFQALAERNVADDELRNRLSGCGRRAVTATVTMTVDSTGKAGTRGVMSCDLRHLCAYCGGREMEEQARLLEASISAWQALRLTVVLVTLTVPHGPLDGLARTVDWLEAGEKAVLQGSARARIARLYGVGPYFRRREFDWDLRSGWHPHTHLLLFVERALSAADVAALKEDLNARYLRALTRAGAPNAPNAGDHAVDVRTVAHGDAHVTARYVTKTTTWNGELQGVFALLADIEIHQVRDGSSCGCSPCHARREAWSEFVTWTRAAKRQRFAAPVGLRERVTALGGAVPVRQALQAQDTARVRADGWDFLVALGLQEGAPQMAAADDGWRRLRTMVAALLVDHGHSATDAAQQASIWVLPPLSTDWRPTRRRRSTRYLHRLRVGRCP